MKTWLRVIAAVFLFWLVSAHPGMLGGSGHPASINVPAQSSAPAGDDCSADVVASDGEPPPGTPSMDPAKLCDAAQKAEQEAACMGDWQPPDPINARQLCLEVQRRGCGDPARDCDRIPADTTYYHHH